jgi:hypothetical protein
MPATNPRINITLEPSVMNAVKSLAEQEQKSVSSISKELILEALERREDSVLSAIAESRDSKNAKKVKHDDAWK